MNTKEKKNKRQTELLLGIFFIVLIAAGTCVYYLWAFKTSVKEDTDRYLKEVSEHVSSQIDYRVDSTYDVLSGISVTYQSIQRKEKAEEYLANMEKEYRYDFLCVTDRDGIVKMSASDVDVNLPGQECIREAIAGKESVSNLVSTKKEGKKILIYTVPMYDDRQQIIGTVAAGRDEEDFAPYVNVKSFEGKGILYIVERGGDIVIEPADKDTRTNSSNLFQGMREYSEMEEGSDLRTMQSDMQEDRNGTLYFRSAGKGRDAYAMTYTSLQVDDWYLLSVVPVKAAGVNVKRFMNTAVIFNILITGIFFILFAAIIYLSYREKKNLTKVAYVDPVTGGYNKARFDLEAAALLSGAGPNERALVSMDIKGFKLINDIFGSEQGNRTIAYLHEVIQNHLKEGEIACRIMADRFEILLYNTSRKAVTQWIEKIVEDINHQNMDMGRKRRYFLSVKAGIYVIDDPEMDLVKIHDRVNSARKNKEAENVKPLCSCTFYSDLERVRLVREKEIDDSMVEALKNQQFVLYLQPKIGTRDEKVLGAEALVRWLDEEGNVIMPGEFIPVFEKNGFIIDLDLYIFEEVCRLLRRWIDEGFTPVPISVNLSRIHLHNPDFLKEFIEIHAKYNVPPSLIEIEITETVMADNMGLLSDVIDEIHEIGFECSLDDFGSGYSSLNILKDIPVDTIKLDRGFFVGKEEKGDAGKQVIQSIVELAGKLNIKTVAEGVERIETVGFLKKIHCDMVQGYVYSRPVPVEQFERRWKELSRIYTEKM